MADPIDINRRNWDERATIHARDEHGMGVGRRALDGAVRFGETAEPLPLISHRVTQAGVENLA